MIQPIDQPVAKGDLEQLGERQLGPDGLRDIAGRLEDLISPQTTYWRSRAPNASWRSPPPSPPPYARRYACHREPGSRIGHR